MSIAFTFDCRLDHEWNGDTSEEPSAIFERVRFLHPGYVKLSDRFVLEQVLLSPARVAEMISVVSVELPDEGMFDVVDHFTKALQVTSSL